MEEIKHYFDICDAPNKVVCKICKKILCSKRGYNLKSHLKNKHNVDLKKNPKSVPKTKNIKAKIEINKYEIIRSYIGLVTENGLPFEVLNSSNMQNMLKPISSALKSNDEKMFSLNADNAKKLLSEVVIKLRNVVKNELKNKLFSIKIDSATRLERSVFGISLQYCKDSNIISRVIGMVELKGLGSTKSKNLSIEIIKTLEKYDLNLQQVIAVTSDNGANMLKTTSLLSQCLSKFEDDQFLDNDDYQRVLDEIENDVDFNLGDISICRCVAHTAQLVAIDVIKNPNVKEFVFQSRNFAKFVRKPSNGFRYLFELNKVRVPQIDCPTRWGSTFRMVTDLKNAKPLIENREISASSSSAEFFDVNDQFWKKVDDFLIVFKPINEILIKFQEETLNYSDFYASWLKCKLLLQQIATSSNDTSFAKKLGDLTLKFIEKRGVNLLKNEILISCLYMDPRFHHILSEHEKEKAAKYLKKLWDRFMSLNKEYVNKSTNSVEGIDIDEEEDILTAFLKQELVEETEIDTHMKIEKLKLPFLKSDSSVLRYWNERKSVDEELYILANIVYGVPPTQVTIERAFSSLRIILSESRNRLSPETLENILLVKLNPALLDEAIQDLNILD